jgi:hypothetical protein
MKNGTHPIGIVLFAIVCLCSTGHLSADEPSLDEQLLEGLDSGLLDDLDSIPDAGATDSEQPKTGEDESPLDAELIDQLIEGDDVGSADAADVHLLIGQRMQVAQQRIRSRQTAATTQRLQQKIIDDLERLIEEARKKQCCGGGEGQPKPGPAGQPKAGQPKPDGAASKKPARDGSSETSTDRVGESESPESAIARYRALVKQVWGHLPERIREQMPNTAGEEFLPKYEELIEDYFERLAEESRDDL